MKANELKPSPTASTAHLELSVTDAANHLGVSRKTLSDDSWLTHYG